MSTRQVRVPPQDLDAERGLLGGMMADPSHAGIQLRADDWYSPEHANVHAAIVSLFGGGKPCDATAVAAEMQRLGTLPAVGGHLAVFDIADSGVPASATHYAEVIRAHGLVRRIQLAAFRLAEEGYGPVADAAEFADRAQAAMFAATEARDSGRIVGIGEVLDGILAAAEMAHQGQGAPMGLSTGLHALDALLGGMRPGNLILVAARPSIGKSALAFQVARHVAGTGAPVLVWSLEMGVAEVAVRLLSAEARINARRFEDGRLSEAEWDRAVRANEAFMQLPLRVIEGAGSTPLQIRAAARRSKPALVVVDYVQLLRYPGRHERREVEVSEISRSLKGLAMELHVPVLALAQLNRESEKAGREPVLADLRDSGSLEQDADVVILLHRDTGKPQRVVAHVAKQRNGPTGRVDLRFLPDFATFEGALT